MIRIQNNSRRHSERGIALFIAIFTLLLITGIAAGMIMLTNTDTNISSNFRDEQTAFFGAKAGFEEVRDRLRPSATNSLSTVLPGASAPNSPPPLPGAAGGILYVTNPLNSETDTPWNYTGSAYPDDEICTEIVNLGTSCPASPLSSSLYATATASATYAASPVLSWKWTRVTVKTNLSSSGASSLSSVNGTTGTTNRNYLVCWNGANEVAIANTTTCAAATPAGSQTYTQVYMLTSLAVTTSGSRRMVQADSVSTVLPNIPGAMVFDGATPTYNDPHSAAFGVSGTDQNKGLNNGVGCSATATNQPAIGTFDSASASSLATGVNRPGSYTSGSTATPAISNVNSAMGSLTTVNGLNSLVAMVTAAAAPGNINPTTVNLGTDAAPVVNVFTGNASVGPGSGAGILLVEGNLTMSGNFNYDGLILVIGTGSITKNGGGGGTFNGAILAANTVNATGQTPGSPYIDWNGGGNASINYDSCMVNSLSQSLPYRIVGVREMMY